MEQFSNDGRPRRREYSKPFKAQVVAQCAQPGASVGGVALAHGLHSNMVHRWLREARQDQAFTLTASQGQPAAFVALPLPAPVSPIAAPVVKMGWPDGYCAGSFCEMHLPSMGGVLPQVLSGPYERAVWRQSLAEVLPKVVH